MASRCETACNLPCGALADLVSPPDAAAGCQRCLAVNCDQERVCATASGCDGFLRCAIACRTTDCIQQCRVDLESAPGHPPLSDASIGGLFVGPPWIASCGNACAAGSDWECVGHVSWPPPKASMTTVEFTALNYPGLSSPIPGLQVRACSINDPVCQNTWLDMGQTDDAGVVPLTVPNDSLVGGYGFNGYLQVDPGNTGYMPFLFYWGFPFSERLYRRSYFGFMSTQEFASVAAEVSVHPDDAKGHIFVAAYDCLGASASGVMVTLSGPDAGGSEFNVGGTPNAPTDSTGLAGIYNLSPGIVTVVGTPVGLGKPASKVQVLVKPGVITGVLLFPTP
jgi:hypothetical protein